jgi:hypothetical protein
VEVIPPTFVKFVIRGNLHRLLVVPNASVVSKVDIYLIMRQALTNIFHLQIVYSASLANLQMKLAQKHVNLAQVAQQPRTRVWGSVPHAPQEKQE